jgi:hypothetical protein
LLRAPFQQRKLTELEGERNAYQPVAISLKPFEVLVFEAAPAK